MGAVAVSSKRNVTPRRADSMQDGKVVASLVTLHDVGEGWVDGANLVAALRCFPLYLFARFDKKHLPRCVFAKIKPTRHEHRARPGVVLLSNDASAYSSLPRTRSPFHRIMRGLLFSIFEVFPHCVKTKVFASRNVNVKIFRFFFFYISHVEFYTLYLGSEWNVVTCVEHMYSTYIRIYWIHVICYIIIYMEISWIHISENIIWVEKILTQRKVGILLKFLPI